MHRLPITRNRRPVGYVEITGLAERIEPSLLPGLEGDQHGLAIVSEVQGTQASVVILPISGETIELSEPLRWFSKFEAPARDRSDERQDYNGILLKSLPSESAYLQLIGEIEGSREGGYFRGNLRIGLAETKSFYLRIDDRDNGSGYCEFLFDVGPFFSGVHGRGEYYLRTDNSQIEAIFDLFEHGPGDGRIEGRIDSRAEVEDGETYLIRLNFGGSGRGRIQASLRGSDGEDGTLPWFIRHTFLEMSLGKKPIPFRFWVGPVNYASELGVSKTPRRTIEDRVSSGEPISAAELSRIADSLSELIPTSQKREYAEAIKPLLRRLNLPQEEVKAPTTTARKELTLKIDDSVPAEKLVKFLIAWGMSLPKQAEAFALPSNRRVPHGQASSEEGRSPEEGSSA